MTSAPDDRDARIEALEIRLAHQDRITGELNETVTAQWREIDALRREVERLREEFQSIGSQRDGPEPPPPHY